MLHHPLTSFEIQKYCWNKPKFNVVYSRNYLPKSKDKAFVINLDEYKSIGLHWMDFYVNGDHLEASYDATYFDSFAVDHIPKEIKKLIGNKNIKTDIYRTQANYSIRRGYFSTAFIDILLTSKSLLDYTNLFSPNQYKKK